jgi:hypothetical protein
MVRPVALCGNCVMTTLLSGFCIDVRKLEPHRIEWRMSASLLLMNGRLLFAV